MKVQKLMIFISCCLLTLVVSANPARALVINTSAKYAITNTDYDEQGNEVTITVSSLSDNDSGTSGTVISEVPADMYTSPSFLVIRQHH